MCVCVCACVCVDKVGSELEERVEEFSYESSVKISNEASNLYLLELLDSKIDEFSKIIFFFLMLQC